MAFLCEWQVSDGWNPSFLKGMPLSLKPAGRALPVSEPSSAPAPPPWTGTRCPQNPRAEAVSWSAAAGGAAKAWHCCRPLAPAVSRALLPAGFPSSPCCLQLSQPAAALGETREGDALCSSLPVLLGSGKRNVFFFFFFLEMLATVVLKNKPIISLQLGENESRLVPRLDRLVGRPRPTARPGRRGCCDLRQRSGLGFMSATWD